MSQRRQTRAPGAHAGAIDVCVEAAQASGAFYLDLFTIEITQSCTMDSSALAAAAQQHCANCGTQPTAEEPRLSCCSRCKLVAYCSKACQAAHWRLSHRSMCTVLHLSDRFRALESAWWRSRPEAELRDFAARSGLDPASMRFFGEVLFLLGGLKSAVLFSNLPIEWRSSFAADVVVASGLLDSGSDSSRRVSLGLFVVGDGVATAAEYDLSGELALVSRRLSAECEAASSRLRLRPVHVRPADVGGGVELPKHSSLTSTTSGEPHLVSECELAQLLDYPVALSECGREPMVEIGYFLPGDDLDGHVSDLDGARAGSPSSPPILLTSYCASSEDETHRARVAAHFKRYRALWETYALGRGGDEKKLQLIQTRI